jgi:hypothetical protein
MRVARAAPSLGRARGGAVRGLAPYCRFGLLWEGGLYWPSEPRLSPLATQGASVVPRRNPTTLSRLSVEFQRQKAARRSHG